MFPVFSDLTLAVRLHSSSKFKRLKMFRFLKVALRILQVVVGALVTNTLASWFCLAKKSVNFCNT